MNSIASNADEFFDSCCNRVRADKALDESLRLAAQEGAVFFPNGGNLGDGLIQLGTLDLFRSKSLSFQMRNDPTSEALSDMNFIIIGGGGAWVEGLWEDWARTLRSYFERGGRAIILPSTIDGFGEYFSRYSTQLTIFAREEKTYESLNRFPELASRTHLCPDLALSVDRKCFEGFRGTGRAGEVNLFRTDGESDGSPVPDGNIDIAKVWNGRIWNDRASCEGPLFAAAAMIGGFEKVNTDRLHMTVLAAMLGCKVNMYAGNYFKNQALYDYSFKDLASVSFCGRRSAAAQSVEHTDGMCIDSANASRPTSRDVWAELVELARLRRDWFEPEIERLRVYVAELLRQKTEWYEPEIDRLKSLTEPLFRQNAELKQARKTQNAELQKARRRALVYASKVVELSATQCPRTEFERQKAEIERQKAEIEDLRGWIAEQDRVKKEWFEPQLESRASAMRELSMARAIAENELVAIKSSKLVRTYFAAQKVLLGTWVFRRRGHNFDQKTQLVAKHASGGNCRKNATWRASD